MNCPKCKKYTCSYHVDNNSKPNSKYIGLAS